MDRLRIALLSTHSCPWAKPGNRYTGGMNIYIQNLAGELARRGHLVDIFSSSHAGDDQCRTLDLCRGIRLIHVTAADYASISESSLDGHVLDIAGSIQAHCASSQLRYDLVHSHYWLSGLVGNVLKEKWHVPHITMFHTLAAIKNNLGLGTLEPAFRISHERDIIARCDLIIASTTRERCELVNKYGAPFERISVVPCGIDSSLFRPVDKDAARKALGLNSVPTLAFVGRMDPLKGLANLLNAVSGLGEREKFHLLVIGGDGPREPEFRHMLDMINELRIGDRVIPIGSVPHQDMYLYYNAADYCVIPSYYESFSLVALESLACGTPVISTDVGEVRDMAALCPGSRILSDNSEATLAAHIEAALQSAKCDSTRNISALTGRYGWDIVAERVISEYNHVKSAAEDDMRSPLHA